MINFALASLALVGPSVDSTLAEAPPLKIWISDNRQFRPGNAVKVQIETGKAGYLLVLHFSPSGQLSVLFRFHRRRQPGAGRATLRSARR